MVLHAAEPDFPALRRRRGDLRDGLPVARDNDCFSVFDGADQFGETVFRLGDTDIHVHNNSQKFCQRPASVRRQAFSRREGTARPAQRRPPRILLDAESLAGSELALKEWLGMLVYRLRGWT